MKDLIGADTFQTFITKLTKEDLLLRRRAGDSANSLWFFGLVGFLLLFSAVIFARFVASGKILPLADWSIIGTFYLLLLLIASVFTYVFVIFGTSSEKTIIVIDKTLFTLFVGLVIMSSDIFFGRNLFKWTESASCAISAFITRADGCEISYGPKIKQIVQMSFYIGFGILILAINTMKLHKNALKRNLKLRGTIIKNSATSVFLILFLGTALLYAVIYVNIESLGQ